MCSFWPLFFNRSRRRGGPLRCLLSHAFDGDLELVLVAKEAFRSFNMPLRAEIVSIGVLFIGVLSNRTLFFFY
jgi:hypothetical protein